MNLKLILLSLLLIIAVIIFMPNAFASNDVTLKLQNNGTENLEDTYIRYDSANTNYGTSTFVSTLYGVSYGHITFLKFNISSLPSNAVINSATVYMYCYSNGLDNGEDPRWDAHSVSNQTWVESEITANNQPTIGSYLYRNDDFGPFDENMWVYWYVTAWTKSEFNSDKNNISFAIKDTQFAAENTDYQRYYSGNYLTNLALRPYFEIKYTPTCLSSSPVGNCTYQGSEYGPELYLDSVTYSNQTIIYSNITIIR